MPSPFAKYTGEQVQQINILPYTAQIAQNLGQGIASVGEIIGKYGQHQNHRSKLAAIVSNIISEDIIQDPNEDAPKAKIKDTAPVHRVDAFKKAEKEVEGDWMAGVNNMSVSDLEAFLTLDTKHQQDTETKFNRNAKTKELRLLERRVGVEETNAAAAKIRAETESRQQADALEAARLNRELAQFNLNKAKTDALNDQTVQDILMEEVPTTQELVKKEDVTSEFGTVLDATTGEPVKTEQGDLLIGQNTNFILSELGIKSDELIGTQAEFDAIRAKQGTQRVNAFFAGDKKFDATAPYDSTESQIRFITKAYERAYIVANDKEKKALDKVFKTLPNNTFLSDTVVPSSRTFEAAKAVVDRLARDPKSIEMMKAGGLDMSPSADVVGKRFFITDKETTTDSKTTTTVVDIDERVVRHRQYYQLAEKLAKQNKKMPFSIQKLDTLLGFNGAPTVYLGQGANKKPYYVFKNTDQVVAAGEVGAAGKNLAPDLSTAAKQNLYATNIWLQNSFIGKDGKGVTYGNWTFSMPKADPRNPVYAWGGGHEETARTVVETNLRDLANIDRIADKMLALSKDNNAFKKMTNPLLQEEIDLLVMAATNYRRYFMPPGAETEPDAARLFKQVGEPNFWKNISPELMAQNIEMMRARITDSIVPALRQKGVIGVPTSGNPAKAVGKDLIARLVEQNSAKYNPVPKK
jgi:hypothetical protein